MYLPRKVGTDMRRKTKRHPLLVYKLVLATTRAANRVHFVLEIIILMMVVINYMTRLMMIMTVRMIGGPVFGS